MPNNPIAPSLSKTVIIKNKTVRFALSVDEAQRSQHDRIQCDQNIPPIHPRFIADFNIDIDGNEAETKEEEAKSKQYTMLLAHTVAFSFLLFSAVYLLHSRLAGWKCVAFVYFGLLCGFSGRGFWDG